MTATSAFARAVCVASVAALLAGCTVSEVSLDVAAVTDGPVDVPATVESLELLTAGDVALAALADVRMFWSGVHTDLFGVDLGPLVGEPMPYGPDAALVCGRDDLDYSQIEANAFYCPIDDYVAWDVDGLIGPLRDEFGDLTIGVVVAHEFAHAVQVGAELDGPSIVVELQADCFAGAWVADVGRRETGLFRLDDDDLDRTVAGLLRLRDGIGVSARNRQAHGTGLDRISAFLDGLDGGPAACLTYQDDPPEVVAIPFSTRGDFERGGNLPLAQLVEPLLTDITTYFSDLVDAVDSRVQFEPLDIVVATDEPVTCIGQSTSAGDIPSGGLVCAPEGYVVLSATDVVLLESIGDFAFGGAVARLNALHALELLNRDPVGLAADCLTGAYALAEFEGLIRTRAIVLSPGDLDEIIVTYLSTDEGDARAFDRVRAFRTGFFGRPLDCL